MSGLAALLIAGAAVAQAPLTKTAIVKDAKGATIGTATLTDAPTGVLLHIEASGLTPGWHGIHFHEKGDCSDAGFKLSGGHVHTMTPSVHGLLNPAASDQGDLTNVHAGADGKVMAEIFSPLVALHAGTTRANLLDADGSAIVIHAAADDYTTQPIGGAGARVACAVVR
jgi:Cu-Zn family superoxide dismutase